MKERWRIFSVLLVFSLFLSGCASSASHLWLKSPGWSRAVLLGESGVANPVTLIPDGEEVCALLLPVEPETKTYHLRLTCFSPDSSETRNVDYFDVNPKPPTQFAMLKQEDSFRFYWLQEKSLYTAVSDAQGAWLESPHLLYDEHPIAHFVLLSDGELLLSGSRSTPSVILLDKTGKSTLLSEDGVMARGVSDSEGTLHLLWAVYPIGYGDSYLTYAAHSPDSSWDALEPRRIANLSLTTSVRLESLALGVDKTRAYAFWTTSVSFGLEAGTIATQYLTFPLGDLPQESPSSLYAPMSYDDTHFQAHPFDDLQIGKGMDLQAHVPMTNALEDMVTMSQPSSELVLAYRAGMFHLWHKRRFQVNLLYFQEGEPTYFQPLSFTASYSLNPFVTRDESGFLYVAWLEKVTANHYDVYFASTRPEIVESLSGLTWRERGDIALQTFFGLLIGALLAPFAASVWMLAIFLVWGLFSLLGRWLPSSWGPVWEKFSVAAALLAYWEAKQATLPSMFSYVPFSAWIPNIPSFVGDILRYSVPLLIFFLALFAAWRYTYQKGNRTILYFLMVYLGVDALFTMAIYAVLIYGVV